MSRTWGTRDKRERQKGGEGEIGTLFPVIAAVFPDVICHSKKHSGDQMFRLMVAEWVHTAVRGSI